MTTDRQQPLDAEEAELAAIYRRLPAASPDAELDAHILAQSRAAIVRDRRRLPAALRWTLGSVAAAVVTVGLAWQIGQMGQGPDWSRPAPPAPRMSAPSANTDARADRVELEYLRREKPAAAVAELHQAPASSDPPGAADDRASAQRAPAAAPPLAPAAPAPAPAGQLAEAAPLPPPPPPTSEVREAEPHAALDRLEVTGSRIKVDDPGQADAEAEDAGVTSATLPPLRSDYRLSPPRWLERIRERVDAGDRAGAIRSLRRFVREYPYLVVPEDLAVLLRE